MARVSTSPLGISEGAVGDTILTLDVPDALFEECEWVEDGKPYREALIPADEINARARIIDVRLDR
jgi:hypothetical protein